MENGGQTTYKEKEVSTHWTDEERRILASVGSFEEMAEIALVILDRMQAEGKPVVQVCGPISTGGLGSLEANMVRFERAVQIAEENGLLVFNQIPFQEAMIRLDKIQQKRGRPGYCTDILEVFYRKVFESGKINKALFLSGWESSTGASWERSLSIELGIIVEEYPEHWFD